MNGYVSSLLEDIGNFRVAWRAAQQEYTEASKQDTESYKLVLKKTMKNLNQAHRDFMSAASTRISSINYLISHKMNELNANLQRLFIPAKPMLVGDTVDEHITNALQYYEYVLRTEQERYMSSVLRWEDNRNLQLLVYQNINDAHQHCMSISRTAVAKMNKQVTKKLEEVLDWEVVDPTEADELVDEVFNWQVVEPKAEQHNTTTPEESEAKLRSAKR